MMTVAEVLAEELEKAGIERVFGLPGGEVLYLIEALRQREIEFILCRHEANAGIAAGVYGKLRRQPGVAITTLGPGAANLMLALTNSILDREPLLAISAQIPEIWPKTHTHQRVPLLECYRPVTKFASAVDKYSARRVVRQAIEIASEEPCGPTYLTVSAEDAVTRSVEADDPLSIPEAATNDVPKGPAREAAKELRQWLATAKRPLVLLGVGVDQCHAPQIRQWLDKWHLPVGVSPKVKGIVDETDSNFVGVFGGMSLDNLMVDVLESADLIVSFGFDPVEVDKTWHAHLPILWVLEAPLALNVVPHTNLIWANYKQLLEELIGQESPGLWADPFASFQEHRRAFLARGDAKGVTMSQNPLSVVSALAKAVPPETIITTDVGSHKYLFGQFWPSRQPETFFMSNGLSGMGYGLSAALGAKLARPEAPVLTVLGDGGFSMNSQELETALRVGAQLVVLVLADRSYSLIHHSQQNKGLPNYGVDFNPIDSVLTAQACGMEGVRIENAEDLADAVRAALVEERSLLVEVPVEVDAYSDLV